MARGRHGARRLLLQALYQRKVGRHSCSELVAQFSDRKEFVAQLKEQVKQVQDFEQKKKLLEDKNRIIDQLEQSRVGPVKVLDYVSQSLEPLKVWLISLKVSAETVELEGRALTNDDVVEFVNNLRRTDFFSNINLQESRAAVDSKINIYQFRMAFRLKGLRMAVPALNLDVLRNIPAAQKLALLGLLVGALIAGFYFYIAEPKSAAIEVLHAENAQLDGEVQTLTIKVKHLDELVAANKQLEIELAVS